MCKPLPTASTNQRASEVIAVLNEWNRDLTTEECQVKYEKMADSDSAFAFYRGTAHLFWRDSANDRRLEQFGGQRNARTWLQGDLHTDNIGAFSNDRGVVVYDINDYDEAVIANYQYDLWRMAVSIVLVGRRHKLSSGEQRDACDAFTASYLLALNDYARVGGEAEVNFDQSNTSGVVKDFLKKISKENSRDAMLKKWTNKQGRFKLNEKLKKIADSDHNRIAEGVQRYQQDRPKRPETAPELFFSVKDIARRVDAGIGSLGVPRFYVLIAGDAEGPRILDVKKQSMPTAYTFLGDNDQWEYRLLKQKFPGEDARWHEAAYRAMANRTDDRLGWMELSDGFYSVRELSFFKETFDTDDLDKTSQLFELAEQWGRILATSHARALNAFDQEFPLSDQVFIRPDRNEAFKSVVTGLTDKRHDEFCKLVRSVALEYADQVEADWISFVDAFEAL